MRIDKMNHRLLLLCASILVLSSALPAELLAQRVKLLPPGPGDLVSSRLSAEALPALPAGIERAPVAFAWLLDPSAELTVPKIFAAESRAYWLQVEGDQLALGLAITTTVKAALIRLNPVAELDPESRLDPDDLRVIDPQGREHRGSAAFRRFATEDQLRAAGIPAAEGTIGFELASELGA